MFVISLVLWTFAAGAPKEEPFKASAWISDILRFVQTFDQEGQPRLIEILDFFSGESNLSRRGSHRGYCTQKYDRLHDSGQDILTFAGFFLALQLCCQVQAYGLAMIGTQCSMWITGLSQSIHRRASRGLLGAWEKMPVYQANVMAENVAVLMLVLYTRQVHFVEENPGGTYLFRYETQAWVHEFLGLLSIHTWMIFFGHWLPKPTRLMGSLAGLNSLAKKYSKKIWSTRRRALCQKLRHRNLHFQRSTALRWFRKRWQPREVTKVTPKASGLGTWLSGGKDLRSSGAYTRRFADAVLSVWESNRFTLVEPLYSLEELLHSCPFPMHQKSFKKSAGPSSGSAEQPDLEEVLVDPTSRPSRCTCWFLSDVPSCDACKKRVKFVPESIVVPNTTLVVTPVPENRVARNATPAAPAVCTKAECWAALWANDFESTDFMDD